MTVRACVCVSAGERACVRACVYVRKHDLFGGRASVIVRNFHCLTYGHLLTVKGLKAGRSLPVLACLLNRFSIASPAQGGVQREYN